MFIIIEKCKNCGIKHEWDFDSPHLKELRDIKKLTSLTGMAFAKAMEDSDPDALAALLYILHKRDKINVAFDDIDLDFNDFEMKETEEEKAARERLEAEIEKGKGASPRPTQSGQRRKAA